MIIDAKYKPIYSVGNGYDIENIRQLSGYARDTRVLKALGWHKKAEQMLKVAKCLIIYPDQMANEQLSANSEVDINGFLEFYKQPVRMPELEK
jgi:5-methylcytosine-specific restriction enzyme subunit McrC